MEILDLIYVFFVVLGTLVIALYATWYLVFRLKKGDSPASSFWEWLKNLAQAVLGL
jgi:hypothetical protein